MMMGLWLPFMTLSQNLFVRFLFRDPDQRFRSFPNRWKGEWELGWSAFHLSRLRPLGAVLEIASALAAFLSHRLIEELRGKN